MAIAVEVTVLEHQLFIQGDRRDPLGVWVSRHGLTGDASGGSIKVGFTPQSQGRIYTCYDFNIAGTTGAHTSSSVKARLLTNHPDADLATGVQGYSNLTIFNGGMDVDVALTAPIFGISLFEKVSATQRFILLFANPALNPILELETSNNVDTAVYFFEAYGYFWDREVLYAPGGPRHPGAQ